jgi:hypothetical protein
MKIINIIRWGRDLTARRRGASIDGGERVKSKRRYEDWLAQCDLNSHSIRRASSS